ncbi:MAG TPA: GNAT family N-acetyltransferase [Actinophytocola sp.]|uniref:GNAT family N-acetyltransferase n=1 Tax=Actinophytocola sp. TaxID=1872138 RepID=UPI002DBB94CE|nr:GNAT family N-acetyltransferase [Actinophytocola sp.]HEU5470149.1 GNAT family N-acetyltransferase [Actinophytocola sp.]
MPEPRIRRARVEELAEIGALTVRAYEAHGYFAAGELSSYADVLADARARHEDAELLVAVDSADRPIGTVTMARPGTRFSEVGAPDELEFRMLAVDPRARGRGVGTALIRGVLDRARELGLVRVVLCSQKRMTGLHRIYTDLGFRRLPDRDWAPVPGVDLIAFGVDL